LTHFFHQPCAGCGRIPIQENNSWELCNNCWESLPFTNGNYCHRCGNIAVTPKEICWRCTEKEIPVDTLHSTFFFELPLSEIVYTFKKTGRRDLSHLFAGFINTEMQGIGGVYPVIPVPCLPDNKKKRGFDPVLLIARVLEKKFGSKIMPCIGRKRGLSQKKLDYVGRQKALQNKLYIYSSIQSQLGSHPTVIILDDVCTTGATVNTCASLLKEYGVRTCIVICIAKTTNY